MNYDSERDWTTKAGLRAVVIMTDFGHRCGYVGIPEGHPLFGIGYSEPSRCLRMDMGRSVEKMSPVQIFCAAGKTEDELATPEYVFEVHGGLTYSGGEGKYPVEAPLWWFGYDCGHAGDAPAPGSRMASYGVCEGDVHRTLDYCVSECESLANQLAQVTHEALAADDNCGKEVAITGASSPGNK